MKFAKFPYFQLAFFCASAALAAPERDVFDTDMGNDVDDAPVFGFRQNSPRELYDVGEFPAARVFEKGIFGGAVRIFRRGDFPDERPAQGAVRDISDGNASVPEIFI